MREEISEPQQWRSSRLSNTRMNGSWAARRETPEQTQGDTSSLATEVVDAAFADETIGIGPVRGSRRDLASQGNPGLGKATEKSPTAEGTNLLHDISAQLAMLQTQQEHLQRLLDQVQE